MKLSGIRHIIFFSILLSGVSLSGQDLAATIAFGDECSDRGDYGTAIEAYGRALFFSPDSAMTGVFTRLGECEELSGNYERAALAYQRAAESTYSDSLRIERTFDKTRCGLEMGQWLEALGDLYSLPDSLPLIQDRRREFYFGVIYFGLQEYQTCATHFTACLEPGSQGDSLLIDSLLTDNPMMQRPIPKRAKALSIIVPGLGQLYAGDYRNAANSFILSSALITLAVYVGARYGLVNAFFTVMPWYQRYFTGGFTNAESIAERKRAMNRADVYQEVLLIIAKSAGETSPTG